MLRTKVPRDSMLEYGGTQVSNIVRYYISLGGEALEKVMPSKGPEGQYKKANGVPQEEYDEWHEFNGNVWKEGLHTKNGSVYATRRIGINTGWTVKLCNRLQPMENVNYEWYIQESQKLCNLKETA